MGKIDSVAEDLGLIRERLAKGSGMISRGFGMGMSKGMGWLAVVLVISSPFDIHQLPLTFTLPGLGSKAKTTLLEVT
jgi:hypothetical protein